MGSLIRAPAMSGYAELVRELDADPQIFLSRFHIPPDVEYHEDGFVSSGAFIRLLENTADELRCPDFGLRLSGRQGLHVLGPLAVIARNAQTVLGGLRAIARYLYIHSPALGLAERPTDGGIAFGYAVAESGIPYPLQAYELSMGIAVRIIQLLGGPQARAGAIVFMHAQRAPDEAYRQALDCPVRFGQTWCGFELPARLGEQRIENADPNTRRLATSYLESTYLPNSPLLSVRVAELARRLLPTGQCNIDVIAAELAMHPRTLQRQLATEGMGCRAVIDQQRRDQAMRYLAEPDLPIQHIVALLGYSEQSAFNRSCRRWFGKTPRQLRDSGPGPLSP
ncbi:AraC family transcriptional regulator [Mycolicibacter sinensis]|uniref:AraC family transcriptional regulator n=2 Tax=Mycolicibacter sinensis (strain JDM601) TaxID=875328 RepID=A0A1A2F0V4_MYCSD|nr:AraC family transcriptional regulator [Mycolicibacter sinensis]OBG10075.1 AraC family transcriptional regulator [Mycolicibacter sinensis]